MGFVSTHLGVFSGGSHWLTMSDVQGGFCQHLTIMFPSFHGISEAVTAVCMDNRILTNCLDGPIFLSQMYHHCIKNYFHVPKFTGCVFRLNNSAQLCLYQQNFTVLGAVGPLTALGSWCALLHCNCPTCNSRLTPSVHKGLFLPWIALIFQGMCQLPWLLPLSGCSALILFDSAATHKASLCYFSGDWSLFH